MNRPNCFWVYVKPGSAKNRVLQENDKVVVECKAPAQQNKANQAVITILEKHFGIPVRILRGKTTPKKFIQLVRI